MPLHYHWLHAHYSKNSVANKDMWGNLCTCKVVVFVLATVSIQMCNYNSYFSHTHENLIRSVSDTC